MAIGIIATLSAIAAILKLHTSGPKIRLQLDNDKQAIAYTGGDVVGDWRINFTFVNDGERIGRVFDSVAKVVLSSEVRNVVPDTVGFSQGGGCRDFIVEPDRPIIGQVTLGIKPQTPGPSWNKHYVEAVKAGGLSAKIEIHWKYGDTAKRNVKVPPVTVLDAPLFREKKYSAHLNGES